MVRRKIALMSGLSDPQSCGLTSTQRDFLTQLPVSPEELVLANFPYHLENAAELKNVSLSLASLSNGWQFLLSRRNAYRISAQQHWKSLVDSCEELVLITISCGFEILHSCLLSGEIPQKITVIALGPVALQRPTVAHVVVQGNRDWISRGVIRNADFLIDEVGHMNYLESEQILELVKSHL